MVICEHCNGTGLIGVRNTFPMTYVAPGPVPEEARGVCEVKCDECGGRGKFVDQPDVSADRGVFEETDMDHATRSAVARVEAQILTECDGAESFCDMLEGWLDQHKHWLRNGYAADLMNGIRDEISDTRAAVQRARERAGDDAVDTIGDAKRSDAA